MVYMIINMKKISIIEILIIKNTNNLRAIQKDLAGIEVNTLMTMGVVMWNHNKAYMILICIIMTILTQKNQMRTISNQEKNLHIWANIYRVRKVKQGSWEKEW